MPNSNRWLLVVLIPIPTYHHSSLILLGALFRETNGSAFKVKYFFD
tara:strand:- start:311 stop:448 length:138 start_codon:yes stop_codon:yes gene_type:complete